MRKYYGQDKELDEVVAKMIDREVLCCDSALMDRLLRGCPGGSILSGFNPEDIENQYYIDEENMEGECKEIYEWWRITLWAYDQLSILEEPVINNDYGYWWGRTCTGQNICLDPTWYNIKHNMDRRIAEM